MTLTLERIRQITKGGSLILCAAVFYLLLLMLSSLSRRGYEFTKVIHQSYLSIEIICFLIVTGLLVASFKEFVKSFFAVTCVVAALSALTEIIVLLTTPVPDALADYRLGELRSAVNRGPTKLSLMYGIFLVACVAILSRDRKSLWYRITLPTSALVLLCGVLLTQTRGTYLGVLAGIAVILSWYSRWIRSAVGITIVVLGVLFAVTPALRDAMLERGSSERLEVWNHYVEMAREQPWLGYGALNKIDFTTKSGWRIPHAHNLALSAQVRGGIFATGAIVMMLVGGLYYATRYARLTGEAAPLGMVTTLSVAGLFDYQLLATDPNWQWICFWLPIGICVGTELYVRKINTGSLSRQMA